MQICNGRQNKKEQRKERKKEGWYIYTIEYSATIKWNEIVSFAGTWIELEAIILSELTQEQKTKHRMFSFISVS